MTMSATPTIHVLGMGSMGTLLSVNMIRSSNINIIPLFRNLAKVNRFKDEAHSTIGMRKVYLEDKPLTTAKLNNIYCPETFPKNDIIKNLIITTKTYQTKDALTPYLSYINKDTNLIMVQNGLGVLDVLRDEIFTTPNERPNLFQGVIAHGAFQDHDFIFNHAGFADMKIARLPWDEQDILQTKSLVVKDATENELIEIFMNDAVRESLDIHHMTYQELLLGQLFKFLINSCINSVTAIVDSDNGEIVENCKPVFRSIVTEALEILRVAYSPLFEYETKFNNTPDYPVLSVDKTLDIDYLVTEINRIGCILNKHNSSSMRQDTRYLRDTEIDYINGYTVQMAEKFHLGAGSAKVNKTICELVNLRLGLNRKRAAEGEWKYK
ncbi:similar to Saccharomyces cerevisiae YHR063C PAN5 dehydropantoate 2-reductase, part of the pantothenic acid pathway, structurally homologous to E. coli panE [Maudiozyma saulgeensis]|uniref:2-dehydropantoate 2-reductase n=1 Tax=Maudiozyma saulgeensis TaxID=1789683 RepID=A0A1X7QYZ4_9SACH|nr:similar to Saccharomyces cerevisiae YHR063C PAN5 dehydropantoate 2-reductase, part of the pantothenic acid pathway, structurally homologous to E. coli panE [Kazachstania saulgeensis]